MKIPSEEMIGELQRVYKKVGFPISQKLFEKHSDFKVVTICKRFGTWQKACDVAKIECSGRKYGKIRVYLRKLLERVIFDLFGNEVSIESEKSFEDLVNPKTGRRLRYDFYLPEINFLIEIDGWSHKNAELYKKIFKADIKEVKKRDKLKDEYAIKNNFQLIRLEQNLISYPYLKNEIHMRCINAVNCWKPLNTNDATTEFEKTNVNAGKIISLSNQHPSSCSERMEKVQRLELSLSPENGYGDNIQKRGNVLFIIEEAKLKIPKEIMFDLYVNKLMSDQKIADLYGFDYNVIYRLRTLHYQIKSRPCTFQSHAKTVDLNLLKECINNRKTYSQMEEIFGINRAVLFRIIKQTKHMI